VNISYIECGRKFLGGLKLPIVSIDIPSGWDVELGDLYETRLMPETLVSLTAPKLCAQYFEGKHHYVGGRFVPDSVKDQYNLALFFEGDRPYFRVSDAI
jgi:NAD(P)H-hydrate epimerase